MYMFTQIKNSDFVLYRYFNVASHLFINCLKSPEGAMYKLSIIMFDVLVSSCTAQISKTCSLR
jgi:maltodextrin utilization protein YvdJ